MSIVLSNKKMLDELFKKNLIRIRRSKIFDHPYPRKSDTFDFQRIEGMMLGLAIGDSLGITTEGMIPEKRKAVYGEIRNYLPNKYVDQPIGFPSDDTQLAFWTLEQIIIDREFNPKNLASRFCKNRIFGIGTTVRQFIANYNAGIEWYECGPESAGNGALMRIAPMVIPHLKSNDSGLWTDTALSALITHNDTLSISACIAVINMIWQLFDMTKQPEPNWWIEQYVAIAKDLEQDKIYKPRGGEFSSYKGFAWKFIQEKVLWAYNKGLTISDACNSWYSGAYLLETIPSVIYILMCYGDNLEEAIVRAVNDTKDNDTIAAIVGAMVGALHGKSKIPERWISNLSGRTTDRDDGKVFKIIEDTKKLWWS